MAKKTVDHYSAQYSSFTTELYEQIRRETFEEDYGQNGWQTDLEQDRFMASLKLRKGHRLLDIACGSGGPALRIAAETDCHVHGIDSHAKGIATANQLAKERGMAKEATFEKADASKRLPFDDASFDALICIDAINHLPDRRAILEDWMRVLRPGGRMLYADPIIVTGALTHEEIAIRSSIGFFLFVPPGENERVLREIGMELEAREDATDKVAEIAGRWRQARAKHAEALKKVEGVQTYEGQQLFFEVAERVAAERRLSRFVFVARKPD